MRASPYFVVPVILFLGSSAFRVAPAAAQKPVHVTRAPAELFAAYIREGRALNDQTNAALDLTHILTHQNEYPPENVQWLLRELEQFALAGTPTWVRADCAQHLALPGSNRARHPTPGTFIRLERVYRTSSDSLVKSVIVGAMATLIETDKASGFLARVAAQEKEDFPESARKALVSLTLMGDEGRAVLRRLHETGAVRESQAKLALQYLARSGFRSP
jgi:hypothetical protein